FPPESDEVNSPDRKKADEKKDSEKDKDAGAGPPKVREPIVIDFNGLAERVVRVPVPADNYGGLAAIKGHLLYIRRGAMYYGRDAELKRELRMYSIDDRKETTLGDDVGGYALSADGSKVLVRQGTAFNLYDTSPKPKEIKESKESKKTLSIANLSVDRVPAKKSAQIFDQIWRRYPA